jgi:CRP-like cAMP-binding protein
MGPDLARLVARIPLFASLAPRELADLAAVARTKAYAANERVVRQGDEADAAYVVIHGRLKVSIDSAILSIMGPGEVFGELALLDGGARSASVDALEPSSLVIIERTSFMRLLSARADVAVKVLENVARRLRRLTERVEIESTLDIERKLARRIVELAATEGIKEGRSVRVGVKLSQTDLGDMIGATRESVNKHLRAFAKQGVLVHRRGELRVDDLAALTRIARVKAHERR